MDQWNDSTAKSILFALKEGDSAALSELYRHYGEELLCYVTRMTKSPFLAEDVVHDTFLRIWEKRGQIDPEKNFRAYLYQISKHVVLNIFRRQHLESGLMLEISRFAAVAGNTTDEKIIQHETEHVIARAMAKVPPQCREVFLRSRIDGMSYKEIAALTGITESTVNKHISKALRIIRKNLQSEHEAIWLSAFIATLLLAGMLWLACFIF